jgi:molybdenum cofactor cytidylyltransferase
VALAIIILAAGRSSRLGRPKQLIEFQGETLLHRAARVAIESGVASRVTTVIAAGDDQARRTVADLDVTIVENPSADTGIGSSIKRGMAVIDASIDRVLLMLADQPRITPEILRELVSRDRVAVACAYADTIGVPAVFARGLFGELRSLPDDAGAKAILEKNREAIATVDFPAAALDVDTPDDLKRIP